MRFAAIFVLAIVSSLLLKAQTNSAFAGGRGGTVHASLHHADFFSAHDDSGSEMAVREEETINRTFSMTATGAPRKLEVNNVFGSIDVTGASGDQVQLVVKKAIRAESREKLERAKKEVTLDITDQNNAVELYVNGPFRCQCHDCVSIHEDPGYIVRMDFQLQVPAHTELTLKTVNEGHIRVQNVTGDYHVHNINGGIEMLNVAGSGKVKTINGGVKVTFRENPQANSEYASLNGPVELYFLHNLSADFRFKTFNGGVFSDFLLSALPQQAVQAERRNGKLILRADRYTGGRVGNGGPQIKVENFNGDIRVLERHD